MNAGIHNMPIKILSLNINGVKDKFNNNTMLEILSKESPDILVFIETHFNIRTKTPQKYFLLAKSKTLMKKKARGGVAVYMHQNSNFKLDIVSNDFNDIIVFKINNSNSIFAAVYLPPVDSQYHSKDDFLALDLICQTFSQKANFYLLGDFNARIGSLSSNSYNQYLPNPDRIINSHGRFLIDMLGKYNLAIINGCIHDRRTFDSGFTFFRSINKSQIDIAATNDMNSVKKFQILQKLSISDHCPILLSIDVTIQPPFSLLRECCRGSFNHNHADINKHLPRMINIKRINSRKLVAELEKVATKISPLTYDTNYTTINLSREIYNACKLCIEKKKRLIDPPNPHCTSKHIRAISNAYFNLYLVKINSHAPVDEITTAAQNWWEYNSLALDMENKEFNTSINKKWTHCQKNDSRKMWKMIDWKGHSQKKPQDQIDPTSIKKFFTNIFQSKKTKDDLTISDIQGEIDNYYTNSQLLDNQISMKELKDALVNVGKGIGLDGIPPIICNIFPDSLCKIILKTLQSIFDSGTYPKSWTSQLLFPIEKKDHTVSQPKLRGIAISSLFPRIYDTILNNRFNQWYHPNKAQSGYRSGQGCILQLLYVSLLLELSSHSSKCLYFLLVDYEKAFDYANRAIIVKDMMKENLGKKFIRTVSAMYRKSQYIPKLTTKDLDDPIHTYFGVTQGRRSSTNFFSFLIRDLPNSISTEEFTDFMDPDNCAQMADDTILAAETRISLSAKFDQIYNFSCKKSQSINVDKTFFIHMSKNPDTKDITCNHGNILSSLELKKSATYLGMYLYHTNSLKDLIEFNINKKMFNIAKFKSWLEVNENTPIRIKLLVLDNCVLSSILYGFESWGDFSHLAKKLETIELDLLKSVLGVKKGTSNDLVYHELKRGSIVAKLMDRQHKFCRKIEQLNVEDALVRCLWNKCQHLNIVKYYKSLKNDYLAQNIINRTNSLISSDKAMIVRYKNLIGLNENNCIYDSDAIDSYRKIITRWRLSNFDLAIETGRYDRPKTPRERRICRTCLVIEDENHVLFNCRLYYQIRNDYNQTFTKHRNIYSLLNPKTKKELYDIGKILMEIEKTHKTFN